MFYEQIHDPQKRHDVYSLLGLIEPWIKINASGSDHDVAVFPAFFFFFLQSF